MQTPKAILLGALIAVSSLALADKYAFYVTAAIRGLSNPQYFASRTFAIDQEHEFEAANKIVNQYLLYAGAKAQLKALDDTIFIVYADGQIAEFKQVRAVGTIRVEFTKLAPAVPPDAKIVISNLSISNGYVEYDIDTLVRQDYTNTYNNTYFQIENLRRGSVTVIQYSITSNLGGEAKCGMGGFCYEN